MKTKKVVHLRVYKGNGKDLSLSYDENQNVKNENILVKLTHNTLEWNNYLKHIRVNGFVKAKVEKVLQDGKEVSTKDIAKEVENAINPVEKKELTYDQKRIADLEAKIDALSNQKNNNASDESPGNEDGSNDSSNETQNNGPSNEDALKLARSEYQKVFGKKGHHTWDVEKINQKIKEKLAESN